MVANVLGGVADYAAGLFGSAVGDRGHAEAAGIEVRRLLRVADVEADVVESLDRERVGRDVVCDGADQCVEVDGRIERVGGVDGIHVVAGRAVHGLRHCTAPFVTGVPPSVIVRSRLVNSVGLWVVNLCNLTGNLRRLLVIVSRLGSRGVCNRTAPYPRLTILTRGS